jgi:hypothetical protein
MQSKFGIAAIAVFLAA